MACESHPRYRYSTTILTFPRFRYQFWINAKTENSIKSDLLQAAKIAHWDCFTADDIVSTVKQKLEECYQQRWLIILDGIEDSAEKCIEQFLPSQGKGWVLLSSQRTVFQHFIPRESRCDISKLPKSTASELLLRAAEINSRSDDEETAAGQLVDALEHLPLAITMAASTIALTKISPREYLRQWRNCYVSDSAQEPLTRTFSNTLGLIKEIKSTEAEDAREIFSMLAFLHQDRVSERIFHDAWLYQRARQVEGRRKRCLSLLDSDMEWNMLRWRFRKALGVLQDRSLLTFTAENGGDPMEPGCFVEISVHSLVHQWSYCDMEHEERSKWFTNATSLLAANLQAHGRMSHDLVTHLDHIQKTVSSAPRSFNLYESPHLWSDFPLSTVESFADIYSHQGYFSEALLLRLGVLKHLTRRDSTERRSDLIHAAALAAETCENIGDDAATRNYRLLALGFAQDLHYHRQKNESNVTNFWTYLVCLQDWARSEHALGNYDTARQKREFVLSNRMDLAARLRTERGRSGQEMDRINLAVMISRRELGASLIHACNWEGAIELLKEVVNNLPTTLSNPKDGDQELLIARHQLAEAYEGSGKLELALSERREVVTARNAIDKKHPDSLGARGCVALSRVALGEIGAAHDLRYSIWEDWDSIRYRLPADYPQLLNAKLQLAESHRLMGQLRQAIALSKQVYEVKLKVAAIHHDTHHQALDKRSSKPQRQLLACYNENPFFCEGTRKRYAPGEALEALRCIVLGYSDLKEAQSAIHPLRVLKTMWELHAGTKTSQHMDMLSVRNAIAHVGRNPPETIAMRKFVLGEQIRLDGDRGALVAETAFSLAQDLVRVNSFNDCHRYLRVVMNHRMDYIVSSRKRHRQAFELVTRCLHYIIDRVAFGGTSGIQMYSEVVQAGTMLMSQEQSIRSLEDNFVNVGLKLAFDELKSSLAEAWSSAP